MIRFLYHGVGLPTIIYAPDVHTAQNTRRVIERLFNPRWLLR